MTISVREEAEVSCLQVTTFFVTLGNMFVVYDKIEDFEGWKEKNCCHLNDM